MLRRACVTAVLAALLLAAPASGADTRVIGPNVSSAGVDLSNLTVDAAAAKLDAALRPALSAEVLVRAAGHPYRLRPADVGEALDPALTAKRAYYASANRPAGDATPVSVPLAVGHRHLAVRAFALKVKHAATVAPRDAAVRITLRHLYARHSRGGHTIDSQALATALDRVLDDPGAVRNVLAPAVMLRPRVTYRDLLRDYGTVITVDRAHFTLRLFKGLRVVARYGVAVGQAGLETPAGLYRIHDKTTNPAWHVPNSPWAGSLAGQTIPPGDPSNPIKARWLGIADGVGIHGTSEDWSIGQRASHGCIRMHVRDVIALYPRVPVGTPVLIR